MSAPAPAPTADSERPRRRRFRGDRGTALVTALVLMFAFTSVGVILLARDYDARVSKRSAAQAIAFQAARTGAQQIDVDRLRASGEVVLAPVAAKQEAESAGRRLLVEYGEQGAVSATVSTGLDRVTVEVVIVDVIEDGFEESRTGRVVAVGAARVESG